MGYGDGFAAIIGGKYGKNKFRVLGNQKSIEGSLAMFVFSFIVSLVILSIFNPANVILLSLVLASVSTILEAYSPYGLDNLTVPLGTSLVYYLLSIFL